jgi:D-ribose pyranose/furanose isomerase RbsD
MTWRERLTASLPLLGHRNWIVVADSAYPVQARSGIETVFAGEDLVDVLEEVLAQLAATRHVRPVVHMDEELQFVGEQDAAGASECRRRLAAALQAFTIESLPHERIIERLDEAGRTFRILVIKTTATIPYTTVFLRLDCAYWSADGERRLRAALAAKQSTQPH